MSKHHNIRDGAVTSYLVVAWHSDDVIQQNCNFVDVARLVLGWVTDWPSSGGYTTSVCNRNQGLGYIPRWYIRPKTVTHPSTYQARHQQSYSFVEWHHHVSAALHSSWVAVPALIGWSKCRNVTSVGWQVTLYVLAWRVSSRSNDAGCKLLYFIYLLTFVIKPFISQWHLPS